MGVAHKYSFPVCFIFSSFLTWQWADFFHLTVGTVSLSRGDLFKFGNFENRKGAAKPRPLCTPLGLFFSSAGDSAVLIC